MPSQGERSLWPGLLMAGVGAVCFAGKSIIVKLGYRHGVDAVTLIMLRMLMALPLFLILSGWAGRGRPPLTRRDWLAVTGLGFCGYYLANFLDFVSLAYVSASLGQLVLYLNPTIVLFLGAILFRRQVSGRQLLALATSYGGVLLVLSQEFHVDAGGNVVLGAALAFGSALSYALYLVYSGEEVRRLGALRLTGLTTTVACLFCIVQYLLTRPIDAALTVAPEVLWLSALNAVLCTFAPVLLVMLAVERIGAAIAAQVGMIGPLSTIAMSVVILGEPFTASLITGSALVLGGVWLLARWR